MKDCIFCNIVAGNIPCHKLYEDDLVMVFLDHRPVREGHSMVIPKIHVDRFTDLDDELAAHICKIGNRLGRKIQETLKPKRVGFAVAGFGVLHAHYHVVPMWEEFDVTSSQYAHVSENSVIFTMDHIAAADDIRQAELVNLLTL